MALEQFTKPRFLLCEGDDDKGFFEVLISGRQLPEFQVCNSKDCCGTGGTSGFQPSLKGMEALSGWLELKALLIVRDNDVAGASFKEVCDALEANGHIPPPNPDATGTMAGKPVAILMIPRADRVGDLETLCLPAIYEKWPKAKRCVPLFLKCTGALKCTGGNNWAKRSSVSKARARAATVGFHEDDPYRGIGILFKKGILSVQNSCFDEVARFLGNFDAMCGI